MSEPKRPSSIADSHRVRAVVAVVVALSLAAVGCADDDSAGTPAASDDDSAGTPAASDDDSAGTPAASDDVTSDVSSDATSETSAATGSEGTTQASTPDNDNAVALDYTGGTAGAADDSLEPVVVGWVNEQGGTTSLTEFTEAAKVGVKYINAELGGVDGHPIELKTCFTAAPADGQRCGTDLVNDPDVDVVLTGVVLSGTQQLLNVLAGKKPVLAGVATSSAETTTEGVTVFGSLDISVAGQALFTAEDLGAEQVAVLYTDNAGGRASYEQALAPVLESHGARQVGVPVPESATGPQVQQALLGAQASSADAVILNITPQTCAAAYEGIQRTEITAEIVSNLGCSGQQMTDYLEETGVGGDVPDGWYFVNFGADAHVPDEESGMAAYLAAVEEYQEEPFPSNSAYYGFSSLLTTVKLMNELGPDNVTPEAFQEALTGFEGKAIMWGEIRCPGEAPNIGLCGKDAGVIQYKNGEWLTHRWGADLIDTSEA